MDSEPSFTILAPPVFDGINYQSWILHMEAYLEANNIWEAIENEYEVPPLSGNPTMA